MTCPHCRDQIEKLEEEIRILRKMAFGAEPDLPSEWGLTVAEGVLLRLLMNRHRVTQDSYLDAMEWGHGETASRRLLAVLVCKVRPKVAPFGIQIANYWGQGYGLEPPMRAAVRKAVDERRAQVGPAIAHTVCHRRAA